MVMPGISMPLMFISSEGEFGMAVLREWQSECIQGKEQLTSQAAAKADTDSRSSTIELANVRLSIVLNFNSTPGDCHTAISYVWT